MLEPTPNCKGRDMLTTLTMGEGRGLLDPSAASLARELAQDIRPVEDILQDYGYGGPGDPQWLSLTESPDFRRLMDEARREWNAADTTKRRLRVKAQAALEIQIPALHGIVMDARADPADRINAFKATKSLAGMDDTPGPGMGGGEGGSGLVVKIVIGQETVTKDVTRSVPTVIEHEGNPDA